MHVRDLMTESNGTPGRTETSEDLAEEEDDETGLLDANEADEEVVPEDDGDVPMGSDDEGVADGEQDIEQDVEQEEIQIQNDSIGHFDGHGDSIFCIAQHPKEAHVIATGSGDDSCKIWSCEIDQIAGNASQRQDDSPLDATTPTSAPTPRESQRLIATLTGHSDSVNAITFTQPDGDFLLTGGLDGVIRAYDSRQNYKLVATSSEVPEVNFITACPGSQVPNAFALGASDGSVWVYSIDTSSSTESDASALVVLQAYYLHTASCTAGAWTPDGKLLATVSEDGSLYVWDAFGEAAAAGVSLQGMGSNMAGGGQALIGLTQEDQRFAVEGGLYSIAIPASGAFVAVGGAAGMIRVVGLPRLNASAAPDQSNQSNQSNQSTKSKRGAGAQSKLAGGKQTGAHLSSTSANVGQAGQLLASLQTQTDGIESLSFSAPPFTLMASGSVDGSIALFDYAHRFAVRRHIKDAHDEFAVVKVDFITDMNNDTDTNTSNSPTHSNSQTHPHSQVSGPHVLTSCGMDGVIRRWDVRGGTAAGGQGLVGEWRGHRGEGEGGGILDFVHNNHQIVTAGDDGVALVFSA